MYDDDNRLIMYGKCDQSFIIVSDLAWEKRNSADEWSAQRWARKHERPGG